MGQPVKLSDTLVMDARAIGEESERSLAGQVEFWASLGRAVERVLKFEKVLELRRLGSARPLSECLRGIENRDGQKRLSKVLGERPYPHYKPAGKPGLLIRIDQDGTRTVGRIVKRKFIPAE